MRPIFTVVLLSLLWATPAQAQMGVRREVWRNTTLSNLQSLADNPDYLGLPTSSSMITTVFEAPSNDSPAPFVTRMVSKIKGSDTGAYKFSIACNHKCMVWLNTTPNFAGTAPIARMMQSTPPSSRQWTRYAEQTSAAINLVANTDYYILVVHISDNSTTNHLSVGWQLPSGSYERPILASRLSYYQFPVPDTTAPSVGFSTPSANALVSGVVTITATAYDNVAVAGVQFKVDGVNVGAQDTVSPYSVIWDTKSLANGAHYLSATAWDAAGNTSIVSRAVTVSNTTAPTATLTASVSSITSGQSVTLTWSSANATSCSASSSPSMAAWSGAKAISGSLSVTPASTTTFTLACTGSGGTVTKSVSVTVMAAPLPTLTFATSLTSITTGQSATLTWSSTNATTCTAASSPTLSTWSGSKAISGSQAVSPTATTTLSLTCTGTGGSLTRTVTITVTQPAAPSLTLSASTLSITSGQSTTLTWSTANATSCSAASSPALATWSGSKVVSGSQAVSPTATTTLSLTCTGTGGSITKSVSITVTQPPMPTLTLSASALSITSGQSSTLTWSTTNATTCTAASSPSLSTWSGSKAISGTQAVSPTATTTFTLACTGTGGNISKSVTVTVTAPALPTLNFTASLSSLTAGQSTVLTWNTTNTTSCSASSSPSMAAWSGAKAITGSLSLAPASTTTFTLACTGTGGSINKSVTVTMQGFRMTVSWDPNSESNLGGYQINYGTSSGAWNTQVDVGNTTQHTFTSFPGTGRYYLVIKAYDKNGLYSQPSQEIWVDVTATGYSNWCCLSGQQQNITMALTDQESPTFVRTASVTTETTFALPELYVFGDGNTGANYDTDIVVFNPNDYATTARAVFYKSDGISTIQDLTLLAKSRKVLRVKQIAGMNNTSFYMTLETESTNLVVERSMFWDASYYGGSTERAQKGASRDWYFADGGQGQLSTTLTLTNPQPNSNIATVRFMLEGGGTVDKSYTLTAGAKIQVPMSSVSELANKAFGVVVSFAQDGLAERVITLNSQGPGGGTTSLGSQVKSDNWFHTDGVTGPEFDTYVLTLNPNSWPVEITYQIMLASGQSKQAKMTLPGNSRGTFNPKLVDVALENAVFSVLVTATSPIVSERSIFWGNPWVESASSFGIVDPSIKWGLADGRTGTTKMFETYILVGNTNTKPVDLTLTFVKDDGSIVVRSYTVGATSRLSVSAQDIPELTNSQFSVVVEAGLPIMVESTMFWNSNGVKWAGGSNVLATPLP